MNRDKGIRRSGKWKSIATEARQRDRRGEQQRRRTKARKETRRSGKRQKERDRPSRDRAIEKERREPRKTHHYSIRMKVSLFLFCGDLYS
jgi:hypothetical protein